MEKNSETWAEKIKDFLLFNVVFGVALAATLALSVGVLSLLSKGVARFFPGFLADPGPLLDLLVGMAEMTTPAGSEWLYLIMIFGLFNFIRYSRESENRGGRP